MGGIAFKRVTYIGDNYYYNSPELNMGINILEGKNGTGKTTFSELICYGLGIYSYQFDPKEDSTHKEIMSDTNNYVQLEVWLSGQLFKVKRYFKNNTILVEDINSKVEVFHIYRRQGKAVFSDWLLSKLGIEVVEIYQGSKKFKISISDLFRLIHYDQESLPRRIYKEHRNDGNFIADSLYIRKVIFELLTGYQFSDYYHDLGVLYKLERERDAAKTVVDNYGSIVVDMGFEDALSDKHLIKTKLVENQYQLEKALSYKEGLKSASYDSSKLHQDIKNIREELFHIESERSRWISKGRKLTVEKKNLHRLLEDTILEVTQITKIIAAHNKLNLFQPNTCPCCLRNVDRQQNECICGAELDNYQYERFFYTSDEYTDILNSKNKSLDTIKKAISSCERETVSVEKEIKTLEERSKKLETKIQTIENEIKIYTNDVEMTRVNDSILDIQTEIKHYEQQLVVSSRYTTLESDWKEISNSYDGLKEKVEGMEKQLKKTIRETIKSFNSTYSQLLINSSTDITQAEITDNDYLPIINDGEYKQASSNVPKRFMYFLTLLKMSIANKKMPFPRFLLIDTPENLGIDNENLEKVISSLAPNPTDGKANNLDFQVILTTGIGKYPQEYKKFVFDTLTYDNRLLKIKR